MLENKVMQAAAAVEPAVALEALLPLHSATFDSALSYTTRRRKGGNLHRIKNVFAFNTRRREEQKRTKNTLAQKYIYTFCDKIAGFKNVSVHKLCCV